MNDVFTRIEVDQNLVSACREVKAKILDHYAPPDTKWFFLGEVAKSGFLSIQFVGTKPAQLDESLVPVVTDFFDEFKLFPIFQLFHTANWGYHRHISTSYSQLQLTIIDDVNSSVLRTWDIPSEPPPKHPFIESLPYEHENVTLLGEYHLAPVDAFIFNPTVWHSHTASDDIQAFLLTPLTE